VPGGQNASLCVMSYSGYDIEDAVVINRGSIDRGFGRCLVVRKYQTAIKSYTNNGTSDTTMGPPPSDDPRIARKYSALDIDGICQVGEVVESGSLLVNKYSPNNANDDAATAGMGTTTMKPSPLSYKGAASCTVNKVLITSSETEKFVIKVLAHQVRRPEVGDKFSSRHGQKGVCGLILNQEDMPFSDVGICPDLIMNPHGFPSRMTVGKMIELVAGKAGVFEGRYEYIRVIVGRYTGCTKH
jgi:DNA-directed RNA polymerase III subunit RPC2